MSISRPLNRLREAGNYHSEPEWISVLLVQPTMLCCALPRSVTLCSAARSNIMYACPCFPFCSFLVSILHVYPNASYLNLPSYLVFPLSDRTLLSDIRAACLAYYAYSAAHCSALLSCSVKHHICLPFLSVLHLACLYSACLLHCTSPHSAQLLSVSAV